MPNPTLSSLVIPVKNTSTGQVTNQAFDFPSGGGSGSGDMLKSVYDSNDTVANAGGIVDYIDDVITSALTASY